MARAEFSTTVQDSAGTVQTSKPIVFYEPGTAGATPLAQTLYDARSGGSIVASPQTNSVGQLDVYADNAQYVEYKVNGGTLQYGRIDPDPSQIVVMTGGQNVTLGNNVVKGTFGAHGTGTATAGQGLQVYADGTVGISDGTFPNKSAFNLIEIIKTSSVNFNMIDIFHYVENTGTLHSSHTATSYAGDGTTIAVAAGPWTGGEANQVGRFVRITQAGLTQTPKQITVNSSTVLTVDPPFAPLLSGNPTFEIIDPGDQAMFRTITDIRNPASGYTVAGGYNFESTIQLQSGVARTGAINFLGRIAVYEEWTDTIRNVIFWAQTTAGGLDPAPGGRPRANIAFYSSGTGVISHFRADDHNGAMVFEVSEDGYVSGVRGRYGSSLTTGGLGTSTAPVAVRASGNSRSAGFQVFRSGTSDTFATHYFDTSDNAYWQNSPGGSAGSYIQVGGTNALPAFWFNGMSGQTGDLARWGITGSNLASINASGHFKIADVKVLGAQMADVAAIAATTNITAVPGSFADLAAVQSYLAGANMVPNIESRLDALETKVNAIRGVLSLAAGGHGLTA